MQKTKLNKFIQKYNLGGNVNSVKWKSGGDKLSTTFVTPDKSLLGTVSVDKFKFEDAELGVYQTDLLKNLLGVLDDDLSLTLSRFGDKAVALKAKNGSKKHTNENVSSPRFRVSFSTKIGCQL